MRHPTAVASCLTAFLAAALVDCGDGGTSGADAGDSGPPDGGDTEENSLIVVEIECGSSTCARTDDGAVYCWGGDNAGQSGPDETHVDEIGKNRVFNEGVVSLSAGGLNACVVLEEASLWCWGDNWFNQLVAPVGDYSEDPVEIDLGGPVAQVVTGSSMCARMEDGAVFCWGDNSLGSVGNGADLSDCVEWNDCIEPPTQVVGLDGLTVVDLGSTASMPCAITDTGEAYCWGEIPGPEDGGNGLVHSSVPVHLVDLPAPVVEVDGTGALVAGNVVMRWASNAYGQFGVPPSEMDWSNVPVAVEGLEGTPMEIGNGGFFACAVMSDGRVQCWGRNQYGQLGRGMTSEYSSNPQDVVGLSGPATTVCTGSNSVCALMGDGGIMCWGDGDDGKLGNFLDSPDCPEWDSCLFPTPVHVIGFGPE